MITIRKSRDRGVTNLDWLESKHTFSFGDYFDPHQIGFRSLRVINEDRVEAGKGFPAHPHRDMEILTYIVDGSLRHKDTLSHGSVIHAGEIQRMTAGTGITHSEFNPSISDPVHLLQIWILPETKNLEPSYEQKSFDPKHKQGTLLLIGSKDGRDGTVTIHQDIDFYGAFLKQQDAVHFSLRKDRGAWIQVVEGEIDVNGQKLSTGDGAAISDEQAINIKGIQPSELLFFDMA